MIGLVVLGLGWVDIGIVNDDLLFVWLIGFLFKIWVFDICVGFLIWVFKLLCCYFFWIGCICL